MLALSFIQKFDSRGTYFAPASLNHSRRSKRKTDRRRSGERQRDTNLYLNILNSLRLTLHNAQVIFY